MQSATVIGSGLRSHPESGRQCLSLLVDQPFDSGGVKAWATRLWVEPSMPAPADGSTVEWDSRHVVIGGKVWRKVETDGVP